MPPERCIVCNDADNYVIAYEDAKKLIIAFHNRILKNSSIANAGGFFTLNKIADDQYFKTEEFLKYVKFQGIPNMSIFGGHSWELIADATEYCLKIYEENKEFFDSNYYNACIIEQLFIPAAIRMIMEKNSEDVIDDKNIFKFIFDKNPTVIEFAENKWDYPFTIESNNDILTIEDQNGLFRNLGYNFNGFLHLNGYKTFDEIIFMIRQRIIDEFDGNRYIHKIDKLFKEDSKTDLLFDSYCEHLKTNLDKMESMKNKSFGLI
jgi:hypothetical protein